MEYLYGIATGFLLGQWFFWEKSLKKEKAQADACASSDQAPLKVDQIGPVSLRKTQHFADIKYNDNDKPHLIFRQ